MPEVLEGIVEGFSSHTTLAAMERWTDVEFQRVAHSTRITDRTLAACRDVLVDGVPGVEAAAAHKMFPAAISRAIATLRDKQKVLEKSALVKDAVATTLQQQVEEACKIFYGPNFQVAPAEPGKTYSGPVVLINNGLAVQKVGRGGVLHDVGSFTELPPLNVGLSITLPQSGRAVVGELPEIAAQDKSVER